MFSTFGAVDPGNGHVRQLAPLGEDGAPGHIRRWGAHASGVPGEKQLRGGITKTGDRRARAMLVQAAWGVWRDRHPASAPLCAWAERLAARRGKRIAIVALARRLAGILFALWRDGTTFDSARVGQGPAVATA